MALHFQPRVNGRAIGSVYIQRLNPLVDGEPADYSVEVEYRGETHSARISHCYEDGALVLITKALAAITNPTVDGGEATTDTVQGEGTHVP